MKHTNPTCFACKEQKKHNNPITVNGNESIILCNDCNLKLIRDHELNVGKEYYLKVVGKKGDFLTIKFYKHEPKLDYWESRRRVEEQRRMSGDDSILGNPSY